MAYIVQQTEIKITDLDRKMKSAEKSCKRGDPTELVSLVASFPNNDAIIQWANSIKTVKQELDWREWWVGANPYH